MSRQQGFTIVELMVTLVVGALLVMSGYQLYTVVAGRIGEARRMSEASNIGYGILRKEGSVYMDITEDCDHPRVNTVAVASSLPNVSAKLSRCRPSPSISMIRVTSIVSYDNPQKEVVHATYISR